MKLFLVARRIERSLYKIMLVTEDRTIAGMGMYKGDKLYSIDATALGKVVELEADNKDEGGIKE